MNYKRLQRWLGVSIWGLCLVAIAWLGFTSPVWAQDNKVNYTLADLQHRDFSGQDLHGTSFAGGTMDGANFQGANLEGTILTKGSFYQANLQDVNLASAFSDRVNFNLANLTNAILTDAVLTSSTFYQADITGADFSGALVDLHEVNLMCEYADGTNPTTGILTRDSLGCR